MSIEKLCQAVENGAQEEAEQIAKDLLNQTFDAKATIDRWWQRCRRLETGFPVLRSSFRR